MEQVKAPAISPTLVRQAEHMRTFRFVEVPPAVPIDNLMRPDYWAHCAQMFKPRDRVEAHAQDGSWFAELLVMKVNKHEVYMVPLNIVDLTRASFVPTEAQGPKEEGDYVVTYGGPS